MRKRISEQNIFPRFNLCNECIKVDNMLSEVKMVEDRYYTYTIEEYLEEYCFKNWNLRGTFFNVIEMRSELGFPREKIKDMKITDEGTALDYLQYAINALNRVENVIREKIGHRWESVETHDMFVQHLLFLISNLNCKMSSDEETDELFLEYNDNIADVVEIDYPDVEISIGEYKRIDNRGDLRRKAEILCTLYKKLESLSEQFKGTTYKSLYDDTKLLFNKSGIRHNVDKDAIACATFLAMDEKELEVWYDKTFDMFLSCMVMARYLKNKKDIDDIKTRI